MALAAADLDARLVRYLVLPACASVETLERAARASAYDGCVVTRLDETDRPAPVLEAALHEKLPIAFLGDGVALDANLHRASSSLFGDLFLRGRVA